MLKVLSSWESFVSLCEKAKDGFFFFFFFLNFYFLFIFFNPHSYPFLFFFSLFLVQKGPDFFVSKNFPFSKYFETTPVPIFSEVSNGDFDAEMRVCYYY